MDINSPNNPEGRMLHDEQELLERQAADNAKRRKRNLALGIGAGVFLLLVLAALAFMLFSKNAESSQKDEEIEQLKLEMEMMESANEFAQIDNEYSQLEGNQINLMANDSIVEKYAAARAQVEKLLQELQNEKNKSAAQISKLKAEIETLKGILRDYTQRINELMAENEGLREENQQVKAQNQNLTNQVSQNTRTIQQQAQRLTLAEKLNVTGLQFRALKRNGKTEKNITKATQLEVSFTIPQNNSTQPGEKTIYLRITNPEGDLLGGSGITFPFEGQSLAATARKTVEYANEEIGGITMYYDVNTTLNPGVYTVELFADNFRIASRQFTMVK
ncbi:MAG: hypothetical protein K2G64_05720 [Muribaculaceae bacterium]|nr:hypothetical protein [Muribaculaceae bacterium]MDE7393004.1 hypothetical protein [Muribaculaceae bacterium]